MEMTVLLDLVISLVLYQTIRGKIGLSIMAI